MKRSEMKTHIGASLYMYRHEIGNMDINDESTYKHLEEIILSRIEHAGMLPPKSNDIVTVKRGLVRGYTTMFEWEDENDDV